MESNYNAALEAISQNQVEILKTLLARDPDLIHAREPSDGGTLLHRAVATNALEACKLLVEAGADPTAIRENEYTPEHRHSGSGTATPLAFALEINKKEISAYLKTIQIVPDNLWMAASLGNLDRVQQFFKPDGTLTPDAIDPGKCGTPQNALDDALVGAAHQRHNDIAMYLIEQGANPSGRDQFGMTALHYAIQDNLPLVKLLVACGADAKVRDFQFNATPVGWARYLDKPESLSYLLAKADIDPADM